MLPARNALTDGIRIGRETTVCLALVLALLFTLLGGCITGPNLIVESPLSSEDQQKEILKIAPIGTDRKDVLKRLDRAGIQCSEGASDSIWYCTFWKKANGDRWHLDVALLFDSSGKLYETRRRETDYGVADRNTLEPDAPRERTADASAATNAVPADSTSRESARGSAPRTPFGK